MKIIVVMAFVVVGVLLCDLVFAGPVDNAQ